MELLIILIGLLILLYFTYWLKVRLNINLNIGKKHFPCYIEDYTFGIIKCKWFPSPNHCKCDD